MTTVHRLHDASGTIEVTLHSPGTRLQGTPTGSEAICMIDDAHVVLVEPFSGRLNTPGGLPNEGEHSEATMIRGAREQACADVTSWQLIAHARSQRLHCDGKDAVMVRDIYIARVDLRQWESLDARIAARQLVALNDLATIMSADWPGREAFSLELVSLAREGLARL